MLFRSPAANLCGLELASARAQNTVADQPTATEIESALNNGITPLAPSANRPGYCTVVRSVTTRSLANGVPNYAVIDTSIVTSCDHVADDLQAFLATTYAGFKLAPDSDDGLPPRTERVTTPRLIRAKIAEHGDRIGIASGNQNPVGSRSVRFAISCETSAS